MGKCDYKKFYYFLSYFIPNQKRRNKFRRRCGIYESKIKGAAGNSVDIPQDANICLTIIGKGNKVFIDKALQRDNSTINISIVGDNNIVRIAARQANLDLTMGYNDGRPVENTRFMFGYSSCNGLDCLLLENNTFVSIGDGCMLSFGIRMRCTGDHAIINDKGEVINLAKSIEIGNHVWVGMDALILKNSKVADGCIVGANSVVTKAFETPNSVIAGNPARKVKEGIHWDEARPDMYKPAQSPENLWGGGREKMIFLMHINYKIGSLR